MAKRTPRAKAARKTRKPSRSRAAKRPPRRSKSEPVGTTPDLLRLPRLDERPHYDFTAPDVVEEIRRLAALGTSERVIAWRFGYRTAGNLRAQLAKPEHRAAFRALVSARVRLEVEMCAHVLATARSLFDTKTAFAAQRWLLENRIASDDDEELDDFPDDGPVAPHSPGFVDELRGKIK